VTVKAQHTPGTAGPGLAPSLDRTSSAPRFPVQVERPLAEPDAHHHPENWYFVK
jgi:hypothetical protein